MAELQFVPYKNLSFIFFFIFFATNNTGSAASFRIFIACLLVMKQQMIKMAYHRLGHFLLMKETQNQPLFLLYLLKKNLQVCEHKKCTNTNL